MTESTNVPSARAVRPTNSTGPPRKQRNRDVRERDYLREEEVESMIRAANRGRNPLRDQALILLSFRHGLRSAELVDLRWSDVDFKHKRLHVRRLKGSLDSVHPLSGRELRMLRKLKRQYDGTKWILQSERGDQLSTRLVRHVVSSAAKEAGIAFPVSSHTLRHSCGYWLSEAGADLRVIQQFLGHANVQHSTRYVALSSERFNGVYWRD